MKTNGMRDPWHRVLQDHGTPGPKQKLTKDLRISSRILMCEELLLIQKKMMNFSVQIKPGLTSQLLGAFRAM
eukprot:12913863-Prorocentrum_lima.AAC.1